jgi:DNA replication licensing factor MCM6
LQVFGRYDRSKTLKANIAVSAAIMSRFDLFFVILDECNPKIDEAIARHIVSEYFGSSHYCVWCLKKLDDSTIASCFADVHTEGGARTVSHNAPYTREQLQKYIAYARTVNPVFTERARDTLVQCYRSLRSGDLVGKNKTAYRITVRQLESLVRLSEALARLHLSEDVLEEHVREAHRLLQRSIVFVESEDVVLEESDDWKNKDQDDEDMGDHNDHDNTIQDEQYPRDDLSDMAMAQHVANYSEFDNQARDVDSREKTTKKKKSSSHITAQEYDTLTQVLAMHLKAEEDMNADNFRGVVWKELCEWTAKQFESEFSTPDDLEKKKKLVGKVSVFALV